MCLIFSSASFGGNGICQKCLFTILQARLSKLEASVALHHENLIATVVSQKLVAGAGVNQNLMCQVKAS